MLCIDIATERAPKEAASYSHDKLKHVETKESNPLPTAQGNRLIDALTFQTIFAELRIDVSAQMHRLFVCCNQSAAAVKVARSA